MTDLKAAARLLWAGHLSWLRANRVRILVTVVPLVLLSFCASKALGAEPTPTRLAGEGGSFTTSVDMVVRYCASANTQCSQARTIRAGVRAQCDNSTWGDVAPGVVKSCYGVPVTPEPPPPAAEPAPPLVVCNPDITHTFPLDILARATWHQSVPASVESSFTDWAAWPCDGGYVQIQGYTRAEFNELVQFSGTAVMKAAFGNPTWLAMLNAWVAARPTHELTVKEADFLRARRAEYAASLGLSPTPPAEQPPVDDPPPPVVVQYVVAPIKAGDRPVVTLPSPGSTSKTKDTAYRIAVGKPCNPSIRIPDTAYMSVTGQLSTKGEQLPANMFAYCALAK